MVELPIINLGSAPTRRQSTASTILDQISSLLLEPKTVVTKGLGEAGRLVKSRREEISRTKDISKALDVVGETLTSTLIAGGLVLGAANPAAAGAILRGLIPKTIAGKVGGVTAAGVLTTSQAARKAAGTFIQDPTKLGREGGLLIDKALKGEDIGSFLGAAKTAGVVGAAVAAGVGAKKLADKFLGGKPADTAINTPSTVPSSIALPTDKIPNALSPLSTSPVVATTSKPELVPSSSGADINIKVINKPQINVAVAQSI